MINDSYIERLLKHSSQRLYEKLGPKTFNADAYINQTIKKGNYISSINKYEITKKKKGPSPMITQKKLRPKTTRVTVPYNLDL